ncbi:MAG: hypothetical protein H7Y37_08965 [Anaerolineae bacterium]|nr:hypothetical protein [Gloeobacterales cyanobacterium ES-bin-313]
MEMEEGGLNKIDAELDQIRQPNVEIMRLERPRHGQIHPVEGFCSGIVVECNGNAEQVDKKVRQILVIVLQHHGRRPTCEEWRQLLPVWFFEGFGKLIPHANEKYGNWQTLEDWLYWFESENRCWWWWDSSILSENELIIEIDDQAEPIPWGDLQLLLLLSGANKTHRER